MLTVRNTNCAMLVVYDYINTWGIREDSRNGSVLSVPWTVTICYQKPWEQVNFCSVRDANPFFHFMEKLWFLEGIGDVEFIVHYLPRMVDFSDDGRTFNGHYGQRLRSTAAGFDQLHAVIEELKRNPDTRQAMIQIWSPDDLGKDSRDIPCHTQLMFRALNGDTLNMTAVNRSNDAVLGGVSGANITNLYAFHEYVAAGTGLQVGHQYIISNNLHLYLDHPKTASLLGRYVDKSYGWDPYSMDEVTTSPMITHFDSFDEELEVFMRFLRHGWPLESVFKNTFFLTTALPITQAFNLHKDGRTIAAITKAYTIAATDWRMACIEWLTRRLK